MKKQALRIATAFMLMLTFLNYMQAAQSAPMNLSKDKLGINSQFPGGTVKLLKASPKKKAAYVATIVKRLADQGFVGDGLSIEQQILDQLDKGTYETIIVPKGTFIPGMGSGSGWVTGKGQGYLTIEDLEALRFKVKAAKDGKSGVLNVDAFVKCANAYDSKFDIPTVPPDTTKPAPKPKPVEFEVRFSIIADYRSSNDAFGHKTAGIGIDKVDQDGRRSGFHAGIGAQERQSEVKKSRTETYTEDRIGTREKIEQLTKQHSQTVKVGQYLEVDHPIDPLLKEAVPAGDATVTVFTSDEGKCRVKNPELYEQGRIYFYDQNNNLVGNVGPTKDVPDNAKKASISTTFGTVFTGTALSFLADHAYSGNTDYAGNGFTVDALQIDWKTYENVISSEAYTYQVQLQRTMSWVEKSKVWMPYLETGYTQRLGKKVDIDLTGTLALPGTVGSKMGFVRDGKNNDVYAIPGMKLSLPVYVNKKFAVTPNVVSEFLVTPQKGTPNMTSIGVELQCVNGLGIGLNERIYAGINKQVINDLAKKDMFFNVRVEIPILYSYNKN